MVDQLARPKDKVENYWFSEQPNGYVRDEDLDKYDATRSVFPNSYFDPQKAHVLYNEYHEQYALVDEVGFDGIMTNEHHTAYWCMKPSANLDAAVLSKSTKKVKIASWATSSRSTTRCGWPKRKRCWTAIPAAESFQDSCVVAPSRLCRRVSIPQRTEAGSKKPTT